MTRSVAGASQAMAASCASGQRKVSRGGWRLSSKPETAEELAVNQVTVCEKVQDAETASVGGVPVARVWQSGRKAVAAATDASNGQQGWAELSATEKLSRTTQLQDMGFSMSAAGSALEVCEWDVNKALDTLLTHKVPTNAPAKIQTTPQQHRDRQKQIVCLDSNITSRRSLASDSTSASSGSSPELTMLMTPDQEPGLPPWQMLHVPAFPQVAAVNAMPPVARLLSTLPSANLLSAPVGTLASQTLNPVAVSAVAGESPVSVVPKRRLAKVEHAWQCEPECSATQMSIEKDTFVFVWSDSMSSAGWIYAESLICSSRAGWLPASMLQQLPPNKRWKRVSKHCEAFHPTQVPVEMGNMILVDVSQAPMGDGWVHAEQVDTATGHGAGVLPCISGWVPIQCIAWGEV